MVEKPRRLEAYIFARVAVYKARKVANENLDISPSVSRGGRLVQSRRPRTLVLLGDRKMGFF